MAIVRVGILHSLTGPLAASESPLVDAALLAIAEIDAGGGVLGREIQPVIEDGRSRDREFVRAANRLCDMGCNVLFGCWTSSSRKSLRPLLRERDVLLWYPLQYEGLEQDDRIIYGGACPNQQLEPAIAWWLGQGRKRFFIVGSEYVFPLTAGRLIASQLQQSGGELVGEAYVPLEAEDFGEVVAAVVRAAPDVVFNTLNGDSNIAFYQQLHAAGLSPDRLPVMAFSITEANLQRIGSAGVGHYACNSYFQSANSPENARFVRNFQARYGSHRVTCAPMEATYTNLYLWKQAVEAAGTFDPQAVRQAATGQTWLAPSGKVTVYANGHMNRRCYIGRVTPDGQLDIAWQSPDPIPPLPWLGLEESSFRNLPTVINLLAEVPDWIQTSLQLKQEMVDRQRAEAAQREAEAKYRNIVEHAAEGIFQSTPDGNYLTVNPALARIYGYDSPEDLIASLTDIGQHLYVRPERRAEFQQLVEENDRVEDFESQVYRKDGSIIWIVENARAVRDRDGTLLYYEGTVADITARKQAEEERQFLLDLSQAIAYAPDFQAALRETLQRICSTTKWLYGEVWVPNDGHTVLQHAAIAYWNESVAASDSIPDPQGFQAGRDRMEIAPNQTLPGRVWYSACPEWIEDATRQGIAVQDFPAQQWGMRSGLGVPILAPFTDEAIDRPRDRVLAVLVFLSATPTPCHHQALQFITAAATQLGAMLQQKHTQAELQALFASMTDIVMVKDRDGRYVKVARTNTDRLLAPPSGIIGKTEYDVFDRETAERNIHYIRTTLDTQQPMSVEYRVRFDDLGERWYMGNLAPLTANTVLWVARDITDRKAVEDALAAANREIAALNERLKAENLRMTAELDITRRLQQMILPREEELRSIADLDIAGFMEPATEVGGDYYDVFQQNDRIAISIGDVTGHGLESGVLMLMVQTAMRALLAADETDPVKLLSTLNRTIYGNVQRMRSPHNLSLALLAYERGRLLLSGQHEEILVVRQDGHLERIDTIDLGFPIGLEENIREFIDLAHLQLAAGDTVVLYTDGITEAENERREFYGIDRLCQVLQRHHTKSASGIRQAIIEDVREFVGKQKVYDDITLVVLKQN